MNLTTPRQWRWLQGLSYPSSIELTSQRAGMSCLVTERDTKGDIVYQYERIFDGRRFTEVDKFGMVGVTTTNLEDTLLIVTEGVSDFLAIKSLFPERNVWGKTKLNLSKLQTHIIKNHFQSVLVIGDNDTTGLSKAYENMQRLQRARVNAKMYIPSHFKDVTLQLFFDEEELKSNIQGLLKMLGCS